MPRGRTRKTSVEQKLEAGEVKTGEPKAKSSRTTDALTAGYEAEKHPNVTHIGQVLRPGTADLPTKAQYMPEHVELAWAFIPDGSTRDSEFYRLIEREGYVLLRREHAAETLDEAMDRRIFYFQTHLAEVALPSGDRALGLPTMGLVALYRTKEVGERIKKAQLKQFEDMMKSGSEELREHQVSSKRGAVSDLFNEPES